MSRAALIRAGAMAAIVGAVLRAAASFAPSVGSDSERQMLYLVVDVFLLLGLLGRWARGNSRGQFSVAIRSVWVFFGAAFAGLGLGLWVSYLPFNDCS